MSPNTATLAHARQQALLDSLEGLCGCTRVAKIRFRIERAEQEAAELRARDLALGRRQRGQTLYGDEIARLEQQAADGRAILDAAQARDRQDQYSQMVTSMLEQALDELVEAVRDGQLTHGEAMALAQQARQRHDDPIMRADWIQAMLDAR